MYSPINYVCTRISICAGAAKTQSSNASAHKHIAHIIHNLGRWAVCGRAPNAEFGGGGASCECRWMRDVRGDEGGAHGTRWGSHEKYGLPGRGWVVLEDFG